jgi:proline racemase
VSAVRYGLDVRTTDYHTAGEPFRIVVGGAPDIPGTTVAQRRVFAQGDDDVDRVRRMLCHEPRGHADMYGGFLTPPDDDGADFGVLFWHKDGFSTACGHGTIALGAWAVESGKVDAAPDGDTDVVIDVPSGRVTARVTCRDGAVQRVAFVNVPAYPIARDVPVTTSRGEITADLGYGGAIYASVPATAVGLSVEPSSYADLVAVGREIKWLLDGSEWAQHPSDPRLSGVYGTILYDDLGGTADGLRQRNVTIFADGEADRSPCGSGTSARIALLDDAAELADGATLTHDSIVGTTFTARVVARTTAEGRPAVLTEVEGSAYRTGEHSFVLQANDPVGTGFVLR